MVTAALVVDLADLATSWMRSLVAADLHAVRVHECAKVKMR
jgi:hypothetical protein